MTIATVPVPADVMNTTKLDSQDPLGHNPSGRTIPYIVRLHITHDNLRDPLCRTIPSLYPYDVKGLFLCLQAFALTLTKLIYPPIIPTDIKITPNYREKPTL